MIISKGITYLTKVPTMTLVLLFSLISFWEVPAQEDLTINTVYSIPAGNILEVNNLYLDSKAVLNIEGTLIVRGNISMANNAPEFHMGNESRVIVYGDFTASNKIKISISSYLVIYGNFMKDGSSNQGDLAIENGNIYIFGEVDNAWNDLQTCSTYTGNTTNEQSDCDYGKLDEYEKNYDSLPPDLQQNLKCFPLKDIASTNVCAGSPAGFSIDAITDVNYQWQVKTTNSTTWANTGTNTPSYDIPVTTLEMSGNQYRVVVKPSTSSTSTCKIAISNPATLTVDQSIASPGPINGPTEVCSSTANHSYSINPIAGAKDYSWTFPAGWTIFSGGSSNQVIVQAGTNATSGTVRVDVIGNCNTQSSSQQVKIISSGEWKGNISADWNDAANWSCGSIPDLTTNVVIPANTPYAPTLQSGNDGGVQNLTILSGAVLKVINRKISIAQNLTVDGSFDVEFGTVAFVGSTPQTIPQNAFANYFVGDLIIDNVAGVTSSADIHVVNSLLVQTGNFATGGSLKLLSTTTGTAFIDGSGSGQITGTVSMQRYLNNGFGYKYFSSAFSNSTVGDFSDFMDLSESTSGFPHFYEYRENRKDSNEKDLTGWQAYNNPSNPLKIAHGYAANISGDNAPLNIEIAGNVNDGPVNLYLQNTDGFYTNGFNLVGNPYPSPIDWNTVAASLSNIDNAVYFFTAGNDDRYTGTYTSYVNGVSNDGRSSNIIPSMQGFFVRVSDPADNIYPASANLQFTNAVRTGNLQPQEFFKTKTGPVIPKIRLSAGFSNKTGIDAAVLYFNAEATTQFDKELDAFKILNTAAEVPSLYFLTGKQDKLSINAIPPADRQEIALGINSERSGEMSIKLSALENISPLAYVYLKDLKTKTVQNLVDQPVYTFTSKKGENNDRFVLLFSSERLSDNDIISELQYFSVSVAEGAIQVSLNLPLESSGEIILANTSGQILQQKAGKGNEKLIFNGLTAPGVYFVSLKFKKEQITRKVLLKK